MTLFISSINKHTDSIDLEDEMDVSALNLGMIATYYNISCLYISYSWPFFSNLTCVSRCDCWSVHPIFERASKTQGFTWSRFDEDGTRFVDEDKFHDVMWKYEWYELFFHCNHLPTQTPLDFDLVSVIHI